MSYLSATAAIAVLTSAAAVTPATASRRWRRVGRKRAGADSAADLSVTVALGLAAALLAARQSTPPAIAAVFGCVTLLAGLGPSLPLTLEPAAVHGRWVEVYAGEYPKGFVLLADIALTVALLMAVAAESTSLAQALTWPFTAVTLLVAAVAYGGVRGAFQHPATGLQLGAAALVLESSCPWAP
jgi:hypothetical protein